MYNLFYSRYAVNLKKRLHRGNTYTEHTDMLAFPLRALCLLRVLCVAVVSAVRELFDRDCLMHTHANAPAINMEGRARHIRGILADQKGDHAGNFLWPSAPLHDTRSDRRRF